MHVVPLAHELLGVREQAGQPLPGATLSLKGLPSEMTSAFSHTILCSLDVDAVGTNRGGPSTSTSIRAFTSKSALNRHTRSPL